MHRSHKTATGFFIICACLAAASVEAAAADLPQIVLPGDRAFPESLAASADGTLYVGSLALGGIWRVKPGAAVEQWIQPGAYGSRSTFGVLVDDKAGVLWVCSNDSSAMGVPGPGKATGSHVKAFDLATGEGKRTADLPGSATLCNDMAVGPDGALYVTNSFAPQILRLKPGASAMEVWLATAVFEQPAKGAGLDGIAFGGDGNLYVNTFTPGGFFCVDVKDGAPGKVTKLKTSRPLTLPDGLRPAGGQTFFMAEGGGTVDRITVSGDKVEVKTLMEGLAGPVSVARVKDRIWTAEGQLSHLFDPKAGPPKLPFRIVGVPAE